MKTRVLLSSVHCYFYTHICYAQQIYRVVQIKVYGQVCSLNQLINWFFLSYILFLSIYTDNSFFANMSLKFIGKKLQWFEFCFSFISFFLHNLKSSNFLRRCEYIERKTPTKNILKFLKNFYSSHHKLFFGPPCTVNTSEYWNILSFIFSLPQLTEKEKG